MKFSLIKRKCLVCSAELKIKINNKTRKYDNGNYFGKIELPFGEGKYRKIGASKFLGGASIVEWTGKERKVEYWECNKCNKE